MMKKELQKELLPRPAEACAYGDAAPHNFAGVTDPATQDEQEREIPSPAEPFEHTWNVTCFRCPQTFVKRNPRGFNWQISLLKSKSQTFKRNEALFWERMEIIRY